MNKQLILNRIKSANNLKSDSELADFLEVKKNTISNWRARNTLDWELVLSKCDNLDLNWLIKEEVKSEEDDEIANNIPYLIKSTRKIINSALNDFVTPKVEKDIYKCILISNFERINLKSNNITPKELLELCLPDNLSIPLLKNPAFCNSIESIIDQTFIKQKLIFLLLGELSKSEKAIECYKTAFVNYFQNSNI